MLKFSCRSIQRLHSHDSMADKLFKKFRKLFQNVWTHFPPSVGSLSTLTPIRGSFFPASPIHYSCRFVSSFFFHVPFLLCVLLYFLSLFCVDLCLLCFHSPISFIYSCAAQPGIRPIGLLYSRGAAKGTGGLEPPVRSPPPPLESKWLCTRVYGKPPFWVAVNPSVLLSLPALFYSLISSFLTSFLLGLLPSFRSPIIILSPLTFAFFHSSTIPVLLIPSFYPILFFFLP